MKYLLISLLLSSNAHSIDEAYWIWAGIPSNAAPANANHYVYQGNCKQGPTLIFEKKGLYPFPMQTKGLFLVFRLNSLAVEAKGLASLFEAQKTAWEKHRVSVFGIQIDFDSPSAKLGDYLRFLKELREKLPKGQRLSITGLGDWILSAARTDLTELASGVDEIVFQMYQGTKNFENASVFVDALEKKKLPFKLGLIAGQEHSLDLKRYSYLKSVVYFVQRTS
jgi:hypothetical protein